MRKQVLVLLTLAVFAMGGCSDYSSKIAGKQITRDFEAEGSYTVLDVSDAFSVTVSDAVDKIQVTAGEKIMPDIRVEMDGNTLRIYLKSQMKRVFSTPMNVVLPYNAALTDIVFSGASDFQSTFGLEGRKVTVSLSGASDCLCDIRADEIEMDCSGASDYRGMMSASRLDLGLTGSSDAKITGEVGELKLSISGASDLEKTVVDNHYGLVCTDCKGSLSGASEAFLHCDGTIDISISGASELRYTGNATTEGCSSSGGSTLKHDTF